MRQGMLCGSCSRIERPCLLRRKGAPIGFSRASSRLFRARRSRDMGRSIGSLNEEGGWYVVEPSGKRKRFSARRCGRAWTLPTNASLHDGTIEYRYRRFPRLCLRTHMRRRIVTGELAAVGSATRPSAASLPYSFARNPVLGFLRAQDNDLPAANHNTVAAGSSCHGS
jgi:hypothetical protein